MNPIEQTTSDRRLPLLLVPGIPLGLALGLALMGRVWWCAAGDFWPWSWDVWSAHGSQHLVDPYALSHVQHGIVLYLLLAWLWPQRTTVFSRGVIVALIECGWELLENTQWTIERYRQTTASLDYQGDSIANSLGDLTACMLGMLVAVRLPWWASWLLFIALELLSLWWIHDSLLLNILMLAWPIEAIRQWQIELSR